MYVSCIIREIRGVTVIKSRPRNYRSDASFGFAMIARMHAWMPRISASPPPLIQLLTLNIMRFCFLKSSRETRPADGSRGKKLKTRFGYFLSPAVCFPLFRIRMEKWGKNWVFEAEVAISRTFVSLSLSGSPYRFLPLLSYSLENFAL